MLSDRSNGVPRRAGVPFPTEDADEWFRLCDVKEKGELGEEHVLAVIRAQIPVDWKRLARDLHGLMPRWDKDGSGALTKDALVGEKGLLEYVSATYPARLRCYKHVPHVTEKREWFKFWDEDDSGVGEG